MMVLPASPLFSLQLGPGYGAGIKFAVIWNCFLLSSTSRNTSDNSREKGEGNMDKQNIGVVVRGGCLRKLVGIIVIGHAEKIIKMMGEYSALSLGEKYHHVHPF